MKNMKSNTMNKARAAVMAGLLTFALAGCGAAGTNASADVSAATKTSATESVEKGAGVSSTTSTVTTSLASTVADGAFNTTDVFTDRDLVQTADTSSAKTITVQNGTDVNITEEGVYVISGTATDVTITVNVDDSAKVQLVLDGLTIQNQDAPAIYVAAADKVFVTTTQGSTNTLSVTGTFATDGETNFDAVIFSKDDLVLNGLGALNISSTDNAISSHDDLKITGGTYNIDCTADALEANNDILIADGTFAITTNKDGIHAENDEDDTLGNVYIAGGNFAITAADDAIHGIAIVQIDGGSFELDAAEGIEATYVQMNDGTISINASDDGVNAAQKSTAYTPTIDIRGGNITIVMGSGDTDALDANGNLYISGGTVNITAQSPFDYDGTGELTGGTVYVNNEEVTTLQNSMMGGGMMGGGMGGQMGEGGPGGAPARGASATTTTTTSGVSMGSTLAS